MLFAEIVSANKTACPFSIDKCELIEFVQNSTYPEAYKQLFVSRRIFIDEADYLIFDKDSINSYSVAIAADFFKAQYIKHRLSFSFETVFSHPAKLEILQQAKNAGFRTYMYFVATESPCINLNRIKSRVKLGGHDVPEDKTTARYYRCLEQVKYALPLLDRAYFFDNSTAQSIFFAEYESGKGFQLHSELLPSWFKRFVFEE